MQYADIEFVYNTLEKELELQPSALLQQKTGTKETLTASEWLELFIENQYAYLVALCPCSTKDGVCVCIENAAQDYFDNLVEVEENEDGEFVEVKKT